MKFLIDAIHLEFPRIFVILVGPMLLRLGTYTLNDDQYGIRLCQAVDSRLQDISNPMVMYLSEVQVIEEYYPDFYSSVDTLVPKLTLGVHLTVHGRWVLSLGLCKALLAFLTIAPYASF